MRVIFRFQDCLDVVQGGVLPLNETPIEAEKAEFREATKRDSKATFLIHQCVDMANFDKISAASNAKEAWEILDKCYSGSTKVRKMRLQFLRRQYELV
ncbi:hypothetical protein Lalb_Chr11g0071471 [Lupinus albus]|uniref:Uncharacterized protein n=1 Tax=Lupinus albus TaxID=3870 RepID=A0A6A4PSZ8_LUPAL|nr:hypothetical protein Lalb_Chr11g0071471 [Lupinus albus]